LIVKGSTRIRLDARASDCQKSLAEFTALAVNKMQKAFSAAACTWTKTLLRLQVWNLFAEGEQIMRAADCKKLSKNPEGVFRQAQARASAWMRVLFLSGV